MLQLMQQTTEAREARQAMAQPRTPRDTFLGFLMNELLKILDNVWFNYTIAAHNFFQPMGNMGQQQMGRAPMGPPQQMPLMGPPQQMPLMGPPQQRAHQPQSLMGPPLMPPPLMPYYRQATSLPSLQAFTVLQPAITDEPCLNTPTLAPVTPRRTPRTETQDASVDFSLDIQSDHPSL
ncbi:uncharacterized protein LOC144603811 [Rhinoraja longicauda]